MNIDRDSMRQCIYCHNFCKFACQPYMISKDQKITENQKNYLVDLHMKNKVPMDGELGYSVFACNDCKRCEHYCIYEPKDVVTNNRAARKIAFDNGFAPSPIYEIEKNLKNNKDIYELPDIKNRDKADFSKSSSEVMVYLGDYTRMLEPSLFSDFKKILDIMKIDYSYDRNEISDGMIALQFGMEKIAEDLMHENYKRIVGHDSGQIVFLSADSYYGFKKEYGKKGFSIEKEMMHYTEFLDRYIEKLKINISNEKIKYFDPCKLGRYMKIYEEPRNVLSRINKGADFDFFMNREASKCCGGHITFFDRELTKRIAGQTLREFKDSGGDILITACPLCLYNFKNSRESEGLKILDLLQYLITKIKR